MSNFLTLTIELHNISAVSAFFDAIWKARELSNANKKALDKILDDLSLTKECIDALAMIGLYLPDDFDQLTLVGDCDAT